MILALNAKGRGNEKTINGGKIMCDDYGTEFVENFEDLKKLEAKLQKIDSNLDLCGWNPDFPCFVDWYRNHYEYYEAISATIDTISSLERSIEHDKKRIEKIKLYFS